LPGSTGSSSSFPWWIVVVAVVALLLAGGVLWWRSRRQAAARFDAGVEALARQGLQLVDQLRAARSGPLPSEVAAATALDAETRARTLASDADNLARRASEERSPALRAIAENATALAGALGSERTVRMGPPAPTTEQVAYAAALTDTRTGDLERSLRALPGQNQGPSAGGPPAGGPPAGGPPAGGPPPPPPPPASPGSWQPPAGQGTQSI